MAFECKQVLPGVYHIKDCMGVCMTLLTGSRAALLVDTGYGIENVHAYVRTLTDLPLQVLLTHGHHDHVMGAMWFDECLMFPDDEADFATYTAEDTRRRVLGQARDKGLSVDEEAYLAARLPMPQCLTEGDIDLGGVTARVIHCPAHTPGSAMVYVPERELLLSGDNWNPCTWAWFPRALGVRTFLRNVREMACMPYTHVLCSHQWTLYPRSMMDDFLLAADEAIPAAVPCDLGQGIGVDTRVAHLPHDQIFVFDWDKAQMKG